MAFLLENACHWNSSNLSCLSTACPWYRPFLGCLLPVALRVANPPSPPTTPWPVCTHFNLIILFLSLRYLMSLSYDNSCAQPEAWMWMAGSSSGLARPECEWQAVVVAWPGMDTAQPGLPHTNQSVTMEMETLGGQPVNRQSDITRAEVLSQHIVRSLSVSVWFGVPRSSSLALTIHAIDVLLTRTSLVCALGEESDIVT